MISVSVIVPTYKRTKMLGNLMACLEKQTFKNFQTVISIDGNSDETKKFLDSKKWQLQELKVIQSISKLGRSGNRNKGADNSSGEVLIFFDDDMEPISEAVEMHLNFQTTNSRSILVGSQLEDSKKMKTDVQKFKAYLSRKWLSEIPVEQKEKENLFLTAANFSIQRRDFETLGKFDENLSDCEDLDLAFRALNAEIKIFFDSKIIGWHNDLISLNGYIKRQKEYYNQRQIVLEKNGIPRVKTLKTPLSKKILMWILGNRIWVSIIDNFNFFILFPRSMRFKFYDLVITSNLN